MTQIYQQYGLNSYFQIRGFQIANSLTFSTYTLNIGPGICYDQTGAFSLNLGNYGNVNTNQDADVTTVLLGNTTGVNALDTGTIAANKIYYVYVIADQVNANPTATIISLNGPSTGPLMPNGYNAYRHIGFIPTNGSSQFVQAFWAGNGNERKFMYDTAPATAITAGASTSFASCVLTNLVPPLDNTPVYINSAFTPAAASRVLTLESGLGTASGTSVVITGQVASVVVTSQDWLISSTVSAGIPRINYKVSNADSAVAINVGGFEYFL
jgi:hypothetical protein